MNATRQALTRLLTLCRDAAAREADSDTVEEATSVLSQIHEADWLPNVDEHEAAMVEAEAKALVIIEAYVAVMNDQLKEQGL